MRVIDSLSRSLARKPLSPRPTKLACLGGLWYDNGTLRNMFTAKTEWSLSRSDGVKKEALDIDTLRQGEPPL